MKITSGSHRKRYGLHCNTDELDRNTLTNHVLILSIHSQTLSLKRDNHYFYTLQYICSVLT
jgi:hypothetical protein